MSFSLRMYSQGRRGFWGKRLSFSLVPMNTDKRWPIQQKRYLYSLFRKWMCLGYCNIDSSDRRVAPHWTTAIYMWMLSSRSTSAWWCLAIGTFELLTRTMRSLPKSFGRSVLWARTYTLTSMRAGTTSGRRPLLQTETRRRPTFLTLVLDYPLKRFDFY